MTEKLWKAATTNAFSTTLDGSITLSDQTITLTSVVGLEAPGILVIDRQDGNELNTPGLREYISFEGISGNDLTDVTRGVGNSTAQSHSSGALVEEALSVTHWNDAVTYNTASRTRIAQLEADKLLFSETDGATVTFDLDESKIQTVVLGGNRTLVVSNAAIGEVFVIRLKQGAGGSKAVTWWDTIAWPGGSAPSLSTAEDAVDTFGFICTAENMYDGYFIGFALA